MQYRKFAILIFSVLLAAVVFCNYNLNEWNAEMPLTAVVISGDHTEELTCWKDQWNDYHFFLPSYADPSMVQIRSHTNDEIWIEDQMLTKEGLSCDRFLMNEVYGLARIGKGNQYDGVIRFVQSGNVPTMYIDVPSGDMEYIHQKKGNEETGTMRLYTVDGDLRFDGSLESIKGRGNATWEAEKKAYSLTLSGQADLLGMGEAQRWVLLANRYDTSNLKNKMAYDLAKAAGMAYSPDSQWVDLYLNGEYTGLYLLCERNEVHPERVNITPDDSFLVSRETEVRLVSQNYPYVNLNHDKAYRVHHSSYALEQVDEMWKSVEGALLAEDGVDPQTGKHWTELIDLDSWVEKYLIDEVSGNHDGGAISQFFYYDGADLSGKIHAGPVWDMDITFGADFWPISSPNSIGARRPCCLYESDNYPFYRLYQKEEFYNRMVEIYQETFRPLLIELIESGLDRYSQQISQAAIANQTRWGMGSAEKDKESIKAFLTERVSFLDALWIREEEFCDVMVLYRTQDHFYYVKAWFAVRPGEYLPDVPTNESGWYVYGSNESFDVSQPIYESVNIYQKEEPIAQDSVGEAKELVTFVVLLAILAVFVVMDKMWSRKDGTQSNNTPELPDSF